MGSLLRLKYPVYEKESTKEATKEKKMDSAHHMPHLFQGISLRIYGLLFLLALLSSLWFLRSYKRLSHVPGPFGASLTNIPRVKWILTSRAHEVHIALHEKHGSLVRFGPNMVSVQDPAEIGHIYGFGGKFLKARKIKNNHKEDPSSPLNGLANARFQSDFYRVLLFYTRGKPVPTIFATQDENLHRMLRKPIAGIYSMSNVVTFEPYVNSTMRVFFARLDTLFVQTGAVCDLGVWLQMFAFDFMGEITFSRRLGFLEKAEDVDGIMESIWRYFKKTSPVGLLTTW